MRSLLTWYQELPYPKTTNPINFNDFGAIYQINDASFKFLEVVTRALDDMKLTMDGLLKSSQRKVFNIFSYRPK